MARPLKKNAHRVESVEATEETEATEATESGFVTVHNHGFSDVHFLSEFVPAGARANITRGTFDGLKNRRSVQALLETGVLEII